MKSELAHILMNLKNLQGVIKDILIFLYKMIIGWHK